MALEKLLIFGLALAIGLAVATWAGTTGDTRQVEKDGYISEMKKLKALAP